MAGRLGVAPVTTLMSDTVLWTSVVALAGSTTVLWCCRLAGRRTISALETKVASERQRVHAREEEAHHLAQVRLPRLINRSAHDPAVANVGSESPVAGLLHPRLAGTATATAHATVLDLVGHMMSETGARAENGARASVRASLATITPLITVQREAIDALLAVHEDPALIEHLYRIDSAAGQMARHLAVLAVLADSTPDVSPAAPVVDVVRAAMASIEGYRHVNIDNPYGAYVVGQAVGPLTLALAALLDNAVHHRAPATAATVTIHGSPDGVDIVIDDTGAGLDTRARATVEQALAATRLRLTDPTPPSGLQIVGTLAARTGFRVHLDQLSPRGGVRTTLHLPHALLTTPPATEPAAPPASVSAVPPPARVHPDHGATALPARATDRPAAVRPQPATAEDTVAAAFWGGVRLGRTTNARRDRGGPLS
ncbi:ATP-binding protein [Streptomyces sp. NPDC048606]|uniref:ATP-binding protein n=1 Tax=Streptomyces sp. NPDC048606 TaxID=3154726 RepID=UPI003439E2F0